MTWRLHKIILYSHNFKRHHIPEHGFNENGISIVIGDSNTGKSAILEIVNYCLGSTNCEVADYIRIRCSWVGLQFRREGQFISLCRKIPVGSVKTSTAYFLKTGTSETMPRHEDELHDMGSNTIERFEQLLGIGAIKLGDEGWASGFTVSVRHCVPYCLMRDDVIVSKNVLVPGSVGDKARHLRETLPYFLGHLTEDSIRLREQYRRKKAELRRREAEFFQRVSLAGEENPQLTVFIDKARSLGLMRRDVSLSELGQQRDALLVVSRYHVGETSAAPESERYGLHEKLSAARRKIMQLSERRRAVQSSAADAGSFYNAASGQHGRLDVLDLLSDEQSHQECPVCSASLLDQAESTQKLREAMEILRQDIGEVSFDRPRFDQYLLELDKEIDLLKENQMKIKKRLGELIKLDAEAEKERSIDEARLRLAGQVEFYLANTNVDDLSAEKAELNQLRKVVSDLEEEVSLVDVTEEMNIDATMMSSQMRDVIKKLPFADEYREALPIFDWKKLLVNLRVDGIRNVLMPSIGSDENYLAIHLAFYITIQKIFASRNRPVPRFIMLDQVTRPYYPDTEYKKIVDLKLEDEIPGGDRHLSDENAKVKQILATLFQISKTEDAPQIIICEKANFRDDKNYQDAIVAFWATPGGMIPADWPTSK